MIFTDFIRKDFYRNGNLFEQGPMTLELINKKEHLF